MRRPPQFFYVVVGTDKIVVFGVVWIQIKIWEYVCNVHRVLKSVVCIKGRVVCAGIGNSRRLILGEITVSRVGCNPGVTLPKLTTRAVVYRVHGVYFTERFVKINNNFIHSVVTSFFKNDNIIKYFFNSLLY